MEVFQYGQQTESPLAAKLRQAEVMQGYTRLETPIADRSERTIEALRAEVQVRDEQALIQARFELLELTIG